MFNGCVPHVPRGANAFGGEGDEIGPGAEGELAGFALQAKGTGGVEGDHAQELGRRQPRLALAQLVQFLEQAQFERLPALFEHGGQAVGANAEVDSGAEESAPREGLMAKVAVAAGAVDDGDVVLGQQCGIAGAEVVGVDGQQVGAQETYVVEVLDWGETSAVAHVTFVAEKPLVHRPAGVAEHLEFFFGFGHVSG